MFKIETILEILYKNNMQEVVTRAIQLDQNIPFKYNVDQEVIVEVTNTELKIVALKIANSRGYGNLKCSIIGIDKWDLEKPYVVRLPSGAIKKISEEQIDSKITSDISEVEAIAQEELAVPRK